jgi:cytochrome c peroxidase
MVEARMFFRRSFGLFVSGLSILTGCGGAPTAAPTHVSRALAQNPPAEPTAPQPVGPQTNIVETALPSGSCAPTRTSTLRAVHPGRGERVVLAKRNSSSLAFVANEDDAAIHTIDLDKHREIAVTQLPGSPSALTLLADGRLVVALRDRNELLVMEAGEESSSKFETRCRLNVASEPVGLASVKTNAGEKLVVTSGYGHALGIIDTAQFGLERLVDLPRDPRAVVIAKGKAYVSHMVSAKMSVVALDSGNVDKIDLLSNKRIKSVNSAGDGDVVFGNQAFALAMNENGRLFAPMVTVDPGEPKITGSYGSTEIPVKPFVGVVDLVASKQIEIPIPSVFTFSNNSLECTLPRAAAVSGDSLFVTCLGSDELLELDARAQNAAQFMLRRTQVARGPLGLAIDQGRAIVMSQFDRVVNIVDLADRKSTPQLIALSRPEGEIDEKFERGRQIFHDNFDPRVSKDGRACVSCHPDGREDGFTWSTPDGPRQTISLAGRLSNAGPFGWFGEHADVRNHLTHTMSRLGGQGFDAKGKTDFDALVTYISRMKAPVAAKKEMSAGLIAEGHALFHGAKQGCGDCHAEGGTDKRRHDVGTGNNIEARLSFDTPSLLSIAGSAPYYHDGRYKTLDDLLSKADDKMGHAKHLNAKERAAMVAYMESLSPELPEERQERRFVRPEATATVAPMASGPVEKLALRISPRRSVFESLELDLATLPVVQVTPPVKYDELKAEPQGGEIKNLLVWNGECATVAYHSAAHLQLDWRSTGMSRAVERCVGSPDDDGRRVWRDAWVRTVDPLPNGHLHVEQYRGYFRVNTHEFWVTNSISVDAAPIADGLAFAFIAHCESCTEGGSDALHVITPSDNSWGEEYFAWRILSLNQGATSSTFAMFPPPNLERWKKATNIDVPTGATIGSPRNVVLRVDVSRTFSEDKPMVALGRATCIEQDFHCR